MEKYMGFIIPVITIAFSIIGAFVLTKYKTDQHGDILKQHGQMLDNHQQDIIVLKTEAKQTQKELSELKSDIREILKIVNEIKINLAKLPCERKGGASC